MLRNFIFFVNPISGTKSKGSLKKMIATRMRNANFSYQVLDTERLGNYSYLPSLIKEQKITDIVVCGGDGSINQLVSSIPGSEVRIGIIPMGSGNGLALAAGIPLNAANAIDIILAGNSMPCDSFSINDRFSCMLCGIGFDAQVAHDFAKRKNRGLSAYVSETIKNFFRAPAYPFRISANGREFRTEAFFISIANSNQFGNRVTIAPKASLSDGLLDIVIVNRMSRLSLLYELLLQVSGGKPTSVPSTATKGINYFQAAEITIQNPSSAPLHIDGEPSATELEFRIKVNRDQFQLIQPSRR